MKEMIMHIIKFSLLSMILSATSSMGVVYAQEISPHHDHSNVMTKPDKSLDSDQHIHSHGSEIYQTTTLQNAWLQDDNGQGQWLSELTSKIGTDEQKLFLKAHFKRAESEHSAYDVSALYSQLWSDFWDIQAGVEYQQQHYTQTDSSLDSSSNDPKLRQSSKHLKFGVHGLAPYFFETDAHIVLGQDRYAAFKLDTTRDVLLTQKLVMQPFLNADLVFSDDRDIAAKTGLSQLQAGIQTRYEINKRIMPFIQIAYEYDRGLKSQQNVELKHADAEKRWQYGAGIKLIF